MHSSNACMHSSNASTAAAPTSPSASQEAYRTLPLNSDTVSRRALPRSAKKSVLLACAAAVAAGAAAASAENCSGVSEMPFFPGSRTPSFV
eukprot:366248-Chlamydomonas_euryale.AAC.4